MRAGGILGDRNAVRDRGGVRGVERHRGDPVAGPRTPPSPVSSRAGVAAVDDHGAAGVQQPGCQGVPDSPARAGDERGRPAMSNSGWPSYKDSWG